MYVVDNSARKATITLTGEEVAVKFPCTYSVFGIKGDDMLLYPKSGMVQGADGVYDTAEGDGSVIMCLHYQADTVYIKGTGDCVIWAGNSTLDNPFSSTGKGGGGSGGGCNYKGTTTTAISNGSTTNPITIDGESYTAVFGDIVVYGYTEFVFDGTTWSEFGRPFDTTPTSGSANAVTSDGVYQNTAGKKYYVDNSLAGEIFGNYEKYEGSEGYRNEASGLYSHAEGDEAKAFGKCSHAESYSIARAIASHAHGGGIVSPTADFATAMGMRATAQAPNSTVVGTYNRTYNTSQGETIPDLLFVVGNGKGMVFQPQPHFDLSNIVEVDYTSLNVNGDIQRDGVGIDDYTTTERKIGKWIDGSDLYQRTFEVTSTIHNDSQYYNNILGTSDSDINIVDFEGFIEFTDTDIVQRFSLHQSFGGSDFMLFFVNNSDLTSRIKFDTNFTLSRAVITIKYTKPSVQANALNANLIPSDNPFNVSVMESSETPTSNDEPTDEMR